MGAWATGAWATGVWATGAWNEDAYGGWTAAGYPGGTAVDYRGVMGTIFLDDVTAVPSSAVLVSGVAHHADGRRYVALWPSSNEVYAEGEFALREDGAMIIAPSGVISETTSGIGLTYRGEVVVTASTPQVVRNGVGLLQDGKLCVSDLS